MFPRPRKDTTSLPKPLPKNTATREYYSVSEADAPQSSDYNGIDYPDSESSSSPPPASSPQKPHTRANSTTSRAGALNQKTPSPTHSLTPSDVVLGADLEDVAALSRREREMRGLMGERERKKVLVELWEGRKREREGGREDQGKEREQKERVQWEEYGGGEEVERK